MLTISKINERIRDIIQAHNENLSFYHLKVNLYDGYGSKTCLSLRDLSSKNLWFELDTDGNITARVSHPPKKRVNLGIVKNIEDLDTIFINWFWVIGLSRASYTVLYKIKDWFHTNDKIPRVAINIDPYLFMVRIRGLEKNRLIMFSNTSDEPDLIGVLVEGGSKKFVDIDDLWEYIDNEIVPCLR